MGAFFGIGDTHQTDQAMGSSTTFEIIDSGYGCGRWQHDGGRPHARSSDHFLFGIADWIGRDADEQTFQSEVSAKNFGGAKAVMKICLIICLATLILLPSCSALDPGYTLGYKDGYATGLLDGIQMTNP